MPVELRLAPPGRERRDAALKIYHVWPVGNWLIVCLVFFINGAARSDTVALGTGNPP